MKKILLMVFSLGIFSGLAFGAAEKYHSDAKLRRSKASENLILDGRVNSHPLGVFDLLDLMTYPVEEKGIASSNGSKISRASGSSLKSHFFNGDDSDEKSRVLQVGVDKNQLLQALRTRSLNGKKTRVDAGRLQDLRTRTIGGERRPRVYPEMIYQLRTRFHDGTLRPRINKES